MTARGTPAERQAIQHHLDAGNPILVHVGCPLCSDEVGDGRIILLRWRGALIYAQLCPRCGDRANYSDELLEQADVVIKLAHKRGLLGELR